MNIVNLAEEMEEEIHSAKCYAKCYQKYKSTDSVLAKKYYEMANDEMKHAGYLHDMAWDKIKAMEEKEITLKDFIEEMWDEKNGQYMEHLATVKNMLSM